MRLKNEASTDTRLTSRRISDVSSNASWPKIRASPPSLMSNVERRRTSVDFPAPLAPLICTITARSARPPSKQATFGGIGGRNVAQF